MPDHVFVRCRKHFQDFKKILPSLVGVDTPALTIVRYLDSSLNFHTKFSKGFHEGLERLKMEVEQNTKQGEIVYNTKLKGVYRKPYKNFIEKLRVFVDCEPTAQPSPLPTQPEPSSSSTTKHPPPTAHPQTEHSSPPKSSPTVINTDTCRALFRDLHQTMVRRPNLNIYEEATQKTQREAQNDAITELVKADEEDFGTKLEELKQLPPIRTGKNGAYNKFATNRNQLIEYALNKCKTPTDPPAPPTLSPPIPVPVPSPTPPEVACCEELNKRIETLASKVEYLALNTGKPVVVDAIPMDAIQTVTATPMEGTATPMEGAATPMEGAAAAAAASGEIKMGTAIPMAAHAAVATPVGIPTGTAGNIPIVNAIPMAAPAAP